MQGIYNCILETNCVSGVHSAAAILWLRFLVHVMLFPTINLLYLYFSTFRSMCAVTSIAFFLYFLDFVLSRYMVHVFSELFPVSLNVNVIIFVVTFHIHRISLVRSLCFKILLAPCFDHTHTS
jgi:hypothetical protein